MCLRIREMVHSIQAEMYEPRVAKAVILYEPRSRIAAAADSLGHFQVALLGPSSYTCRAPSTIDFALPQYLLIRVSHNVSRPEILLIWRL